MREFQIQKQVRTVTGRAPQRGAALIIALLAITVITGVGFALILSSSTEALIHGNFRGAGMVLTGARGGVEEARGRLGPDAAAAVKICATEPAADCTCVGGGCGGAPPLLSDTNKAIYIRQNNTYDPGNPACSYLNMPCADPNAPAPADRIYLSTAQTGTMASYAWAKITLATQVKLNRNMVTPGVPPIDDVTRICWNWRNLILAPVSNPTCNIDGIPALSPAFAFTALAIEPGGARRVLREVATYGTLPGVPGPLTLCGPNSVYPPPTSNRYAVSGVDQGNPPDPNAYAIGVCNDPDVAAIRTSICALPSNRWRAYPGFGSFPDPTADPSDCPATMKGDPRDGPSVGNVSATMDPQYQTCGGLQDIVNQIIGAADYVYNGPVSTFTNFGSPTDPVVNVVIGDATLSASDFPSPPNTGTGIILVTGNMRVTGYPDYNGVIFVIGNGYLEFNGAGSGTINGGVYIANTTTCPTGLGSPTFLTSGGGTLLIQYNSDLTRLFNGYMPLRILSLNY